MLGKYIVVRLPLDNNKICLFRGIFKHLGSLLPRNTKRVAAGADNLCCDIMYAYKFSIINRCVTCNSAPAKRGDYGWRIFEQFFNKQLIQRNLTNVVMNKENIF